MRLLQLKLRGLGNLPVTDWVPLSKTITLLRCQDRQVGRQFLEAVQSLNPPYDCLTEQPYRSLPRKEVLANGHRRLIQPEKRTIVIGIFDTPSILVKELGALTPPLYETDRVEVGRRLDYSSWLNFVEIASSSRWSEVAGDIRKLTHEYPDAAGTQNILRLLTEAVPSDRIKGEMAEELERWLSLVEDRLPATESYPDLMEKIVRARKFTEARKLIFQRLPQFLALNGSDLPPVAELPIGENSSRFPPLILIDCCAANQIEQSSTAIPTEFAAFAEQYQCLCFADSRHRGWDLPAAQVVDIEALN